MIYEPAVEITIRNVDGTKSQFYKDSHFSDLCYCFETPTVLKIAYREVSTIIFRTLYVGTNNIVSVEIIRTSINQQEADILPEPLKVFARKKQQKD